MRRRVVRELGRGLPRMMLALCLGGSACSVLLDSNNLVGDGRCTTCDAGADAPVGVGDGGDGDGAMTAAHCFGREGPSFVDAGVFCIDETEVTVGQYAKFVEAMRADASGQPTECAWNATYVPNSSCVDHNPPDRPDRAVVGVDWCDAVAYCRWAGKRLCGRLGGGALPKAEVNSAAADQWYAACSSFGARRLPADAAACNLAPYDAGSIVEIETCTGGAAPTLRDMIGNAAEWSDSCALNDGGPQGQSCQLRGGSYATPTSECGQLGGADRNARLCTVGFRCCSDP